MSKYNTREALFKASRTTSESAWNSWVMSLCDSSSQVLPDLYHISFDDNLPKHITPKPPFAIHDEAHEVYNEPLPPRISTSPSILGCWRGIYANYSTLLEDHDDVKCVRVHVYKVVPDKNSLILKPDVATREWLLYDAHITDEHCIFGSSHLIKVGYIDIENTTSEPDQRWDTFHPFNLKKYSMLFSNPPFRILKSTINNTVTLEEYHHSLSEFNMSNVIKSEIQDKNQYHLESISLESIDNPFRGINEIIKRSLHTIVSNVPTFDPKCKLSNDLGPTIKHFNDSTDFKTLKKVNHLEVKDRKVVVPVGFTGDYLGYFNLLSDQIKAMQDIVPAVIEPTHNLVLKYIGRPETMSVIDNSDLDKIKLHSAQIEKFKKEMNKYFDSKRSHQSLPIGKLIRNTKELQELSMNIRTETLPWMQNSDWRDSVFRSYGKLQSSLDLLLVRIEQKPEQYNLSKLNAERLARLINDVAVEIELTGALFVYINQLISCVVDLQLAIYEELKD